ncbi:MAG: hypothetical protein JWM10_1017 [Myxococcaceae bacterium]|nr:hypothetical protein [Myxococcaceae bacterium]
MERDPKHPGLLLPAPQAVRRALGPEGIRAELVLTRLDGTPLNETQVRLAKAVLSLIDAEHEVSLAGPVDATPLPPLRRSARK